MSTRNVLAFVRHNPGVFLRSRVFQRVIKPVSFKCHLPLFTDKKFSSNFSIKEILPPQDAFAMRHIGPRKEETNEMIKFLELKVCFFYFLL